MASLLCVLAILAFSVQYSNAHFPNWDYEDSQTCGQPSTQPGGGMRNGGYAEAQSAPWQARLCLNNYPRPGVRTCFCGGVLISTRFILTAAHCFNEIPYYMINHKLIIQLGEGIATYYPSRNGVIKHPSFDRHLYDHDIALIRLSRDVRLSTNIQPACLPDPDIPLSQRSAFVTGWDRGLRLRELSTVLIRWRDCVSIPRHRNHIITTNMFCARELSTNANVVKGFSGGPLVTSQNGHWMVQGLVSWGIPGRDITVFTEVAKYSSWLLDEWGVLGW